MRQITFLVTIKFSTDLEPTVVRNYVKMAICKYDKLVQKLEKHSGYFSNSRPDPSFNITEIEPVDRSDLRGAVQQVNDLVKHFEKLDEYDPIKDNDL